MDYTRMVGRNIQLIMKEKNIEKNEMANRLHYSYAEICRLLEGKLLLLPQQMKEIANLLGVQTLDLKRERSREEYGAFSDCMGFFSDETKEDDILDIIDMYIDVKEKAEQI